VREVNSHVSGARLECKGSNVWQMIQIKRRPTENGRASNHTKQPIASARREKRLRAKTERVKACRARMTYTDELKDGTQIVGPFTTPPGNPDAAVVEVDVGGRMYWVQHTGLPLSASQLDEVKEWVARRLPAH
jgi:hypothetical protein